MQSVRSSPVTWCVDRALLISLAILVALGERSPQLPFGGTPGRVKNKVHRDPDCPGEWEEGHRKGDHDRDGDDFLPNQ